MSDALQSTNHLPTVTIVVLNYNGVEHLKECFPSLAQIDYPRERLELMLVDNASTDESVEFTRANYPLVRIIQSETNRGWGAGNNLGARNTTSQYVIFLNNDMWVQPGFVRESLKALQSCPEAVCASAKILNWDGTQFDFAGAASHFAGHCYPVAWREPFRADQFTKIEPLLFPCGGAMLIDRQIFLDVGGFDEDFFIYYDDLDLGWRLWVLGYQIVFAPDAVAYHRHRGTMQKFQDYRKQVLYKRNALYAVIKNYDDENLGRVLPAALLARVDAVVKHAAQTGRLNLDEFGIQGAASGGSDVAFEKNDVSALYALHVLVEHLPQLMERRRWIQAHRRRADAEIVPLFRRPFLFWEDIAFETQSRVGDAFGIQSIFEHLPRRVLVISSDILPFPGLPTVGSGLRAWGLGQGLSARGHHVRFAMPREALGQAKEPLPAEVVELAWEPHTLAHIAQIADPDVIIVCNWPVLDLLPTENIHVPIILDQHGPHNIEREYQKYGDPEDNARRKLNAFRKADFFTCAGKKQLRYFQTWLERAGWNEQERQTRTTALPVSLSPDLPEHHSSGEPTFVYGGTFLPWQDPSLGLSLLVEELDRRERGKLHFFGGKHPFYPVDTGIFESLLARLKASPRVIVPGTIPRDKLIAEYTRADVAMDVMKRNPERELAFTTRTVEYLWCGVPVIYGDYAELSDYIREYDAGWIVNPEEPEQIRAALAEIFEHPEIVAEKSRNAQRLVRECLTWDRTIDALDRIVRHPSLRHYPAIQTGSPQMSLPLQARYDFRFFKNRAALYLRQGGVGLLAARGLTFFGRQLKSLGRC